MMYSIVKGGYSNNDILLPSFWRNEGLKKILANYKIFCKDLIIYKQKIGVSKMKTDFIGLEIYMGTLLGTMQKQLTLFGQTRVKIVIGLQGNWLSNSIVRIKIFEET